MRLKEALEEVEAIRMVSLPTDEELDTLVTLSPEFERRMQKLIRRQRDHIMFLSARREDAPRQL
jgi:hypothetical protein